MITSIGRFGSAAALVMLLGVGVRAGTWELKVQGADTVVADSAATADGGLAVCGYYAAAGRGFDVFVLKLAADGSRDWLWTYGGRGDDLCMGFVETRDRGFAVAVRTGSQGGSYPWLVKLDAQGDRQWDAMIPGEGSTTVSHMVATPWGFMVTGFYFGRIGAQGPMAAGLGSDGGLLWINNYDGAETRGIAAARGGYVIGGMKGSARAGGASRVWVFKIDERGRALWEREYSDAGDELHDIRPLSDGGFLVAGASRPGESRGSDALVMKLAADGEVLWRRTFGGIQDDVAYAALETPDGELLVAGRTDSTGPGLSNGWLFALDSDGGLIWERTFGAAKRDALLSVQAVPGGLYAVGIGDTWQLRAGGELLVFRLDAQGGFDRSLTRSFRDPAAVAAVRPRPLGQPEPEPEPEPEAVSVAPNKVFEMRVIPPTMIRKPRGEPEPACVEPEPVQCSQARREVYCSLAGSFTVERYDGWEFRYATTDILTLMEPATRSSLLARFIESPVAWSDPEALIRWLAADLQTHFPDARVLQAGEFAARGRRGFTVVMDLAEQARERFKGARYQTLVFPRGDGLLQFAALWDSRDPGVSAAVECMFRSIFFLE